LKLLFLAIAVGLLTAHATAQQQAALHASDATNHTYLGRSVSLSGTTMLVGAGRTTTPAVVQGSAYVFVASGPSWSQQAKLLPNDPQNNAHFGSVVGLSGETAAIGAPSGYLTVQGANQGAAYAFVRSGTSWAQEAKLTASDAAVADMLGYSIAIDADTIVAGAPFRDDLGSNSGAAYVFVRSGSTWSQQAKLLASDGAAGDQFGGSVTIQGDTLVVGAPRDDGTGPDLGSAYVFVRSGSSWTEQAKLSASDAAAGDAFGRSLSVFGEAVVIGANQKNEHGLRSGAAYVFDRSGSTWTQQAKLVPSDGSAFADFGRSVSMGSGAILVGACQDKVSGRGSGSAYLFIGSSWAWTQDRKLTPAVSAAGDFFGVSVSLSGGMAAIGAHSSDDVFVDAGTAYPFTVEPPGVPFCGPDGILTTACPCANPPAGPHRGCDNKNLTGGATLDGYGVASVSSSSLFFVTSGEVPTAFSILLQGSTATVGSQFGHGVRCLGAFKRLYSRLAVAGSVTMPAGLEPSIPVRSAALSAPIPPGSTRWYQVYYRDNSSAFGGPPSCQDMAFRLNITDGQAVLWGP